MENINAINIIFENGDNILLNKNKLKDIYITNLNKQGEEEPFKETIIKNKLYANFFLMNIKGDSLDIDTKNRLKNQKDIIEIQVILDNHKYINFDIASTADPFSKPYNNTYEYITENETSLGILLSEYNIKYKDNLFI